MHDENWTHKDSSSNSVKAVMFITTSDGSSYGYVTHSMHINNSLHSFNLTHFIRKPIQRRFRQNFHQTYIVGLYASILQGI